MAYQSEVNYERARHRWAKPFHENFCFLLSVCFHSAKPPLSKFASRRLLSFAEESDLRKFAGQQWWLRPAAK
jgi:hypothetical protein